MVNRFKSNESSEWLRHLCPSVRLSTRPFLSICLLIRPGRRTPIVTVVAGVVPTFFAEMATEMSLLLRTTLGALVVTRRVGQAWAAALPVRSPSTAAARARTVAARFMLELGWWWWWYLLAVK